MASEAPSATGPGTGFQPHVPPGAVMRECTPRAIILGTLLGIVFGASSLYLVLKVGLTVSASIPVAVISLALFRLWSKVGGRDATILENNIVQTAGSAGESIAFGLGVTMPAIMILGFDLEISRVMLVGAGQTALAGSDPLLQRLRDRFIIPVELSDSDVETVTRRAEMPNRSGSTIARMAATVAS